MKHWFIRDGSIRTVCQFVLTIFGVALIFLDVRIWDTGWIYLVGLVLAGVGGISGKATALRIKPFEGAPYPPGWLEKRTEGGVARDGETEKKNEDKV
ncbi:hypothetical protein [Achromobacter deleyi]|uniref:hypothetical protein n=1 Tax=Achromobacter deleyi TaxID=1353891 RepID=UPI001581D221|nr:hypothetical protein [Achromobacter deleyi]